MKTSVPDEGDRRTIETELDTNLLVEASAGTGKTFSLVSRIASLVRSGKARMSEIAGVTFTRKAAAQLRERVAAALDKQLRAPLSRLTDAERQRLAAARDEIDRAFLGTIHSFCSRLLRERPVEAGIAPDFVEPDEDEAALLREESWRRSLESLRGREEILAELLALGVAPHRLRKAYERLCDYPDVTVAARAVPAPNLSRAVAEEGRFLDEVIPVLQSLGRAHTPDDLGAAAWAAHYFRLNNDPGDPPAAADFLAILRKATATQNRWPKPALGKRFSDQAKALQRDWIEPALEAWYAHCHGPVIGFLEKAAGDFRSERLETSRPHPNFTDLLLLCRDMLRDHPSVRQHFQERYPRLLVDEFQDTDPIQAEVMLLLASGDPREQDWRKVVPRPGSLFVVGDPKQSIYRFRRADIETYDQVRSILESSGGAVTRLSQSFRSSPEICAFVNSVFAGHFRPGIVHQAQDVPLVPFRSGVAGTLVPGAYRLIHRVAGDRHAPVWEADAEGVASWIASAIRGGRTISMREHAGERVRPVGPEDFLVILRNTHRLDAYARALEAKGVPTAVAGGKAFKDSEEVRAFVPFLQALADPEDPVPVVAFLRGPYCGVDDDSLYRFKAAGGRFSYRSDVPEGSDFRIVRAFEQMQTGRKHLRNLPPGAAIARLAESLGILPEAYAREVGERRAGNLEKALGMARRLSSEGKSFSEIVAALADLLESAEAPEMTIDPVKERAVRITNLHKAKGLEAPIVFLAGPVSDSRRDGRDVWIDRSVDPPQGHFFIRDDSGAEVARPADWKREKELEKAHQAAEDARLLYVAATRAMNTLVVSGWIDTTTQKENTHHGPWKDLVLSPLPDLPRLPEVPELARKPPEIEAGSFEAALAEIEGSRARSSAATFATSTPSKFEGTKTFAPREAMGKGMAWGRVLHRLLEASMKNGRGKLEVEKYATELLRQEERDPAELPELLAALEGVVASDLWRRAKSAQERLVEVPFATVVRSIDYGLPDPPGETLLNGTIDLVFKEGGVWKLIDYKTDTISGPVEDLAAFYEPQLRAYRDQWQKLTREKTEAGLYFIANGKVEWLERSP